MIMQQFFSNKIKLNIYVQLEDIFIFLNDLFL